VCVCVYVCVCVRVRVRESVRCACVSGCTSELLRSGLAHGSTRVRARERGDSHIYSSVEYIYSSVELARDNAYRPQGPGAHSREPLYAKHGRDRECFHAQRK